MSLTPSPALPSLLSRLFTLIRVGAPGLDSETRVRPPHPFDLLHGTDTGGLLYADDLTTGHAHDCFNEGYYATAPSLFQGALECWEWTVRGWNPEDYSFVDLGCGKGRVLLLASRSPFRSIRGIELHPRLARTARRNIRKWLKTDLRSETRETACRNLSVDCGDVLNLELPDHPALLFLFNSFGDEVLTPLTQKLAAAARRRGAPIDLIYIHPDHDRLVARTPGIELLRWTEIPFSEEDAAADAFGVSSDPVAIYRMAGGMAK